MQILDRTLGVGHPTYIIAEMSANHGQDFERAARLVQVAAESGADAIKIQTYLPETLTIQSGQDHFRIKGTLWENQNLFDLYGTAYTPWDWTEKLQKLATDLGMHFFSTAYDASSVDFLETLKMPVYKVASFENVDLPLLKKIGSTGKPVLMSTGMANLSEIHEAVEALRGSGCPALALLKCTSAYPCLPDEMNLRTIPHLAQAFSVPVGLSDHSLEVAVPVAAVTLGACVIEKHFILDRAEGGPDSAFSLQPEEFRAMVQAVRVTEKALGGVSYGPTSQEQPSRAFRRSLFAVQDVSRGEVFTPQNVRSIRPAAGLHTRYYEEILGKSASTDIERGTPLSWELVGGAAEPTNLSLER